MKKFLVAMAAVMAMTVSINAKDNNAKACPEGAKCDKQEQCKGDKKDCAQGYCPFEGLNLTDAQKTQIQELRKQCAEQQKVAKDQQKADKQQKKADKKEARQNCKKEMLGKIKAILTPEQYVQFLENSFINNGGGQQGKQAMKGQRPGKQGDRQGQRPGQRGQRPERPQQPAEVQQ